MAKNGASRRVEVNTDTITFGVEIECTLPESFIQERGIEIGSYRHGAALPAPFPIGWVAKYDSSVRENDLRYEALEIVSPVLKGKDGLEEVLAVYDILNEAGATVNTSCGFHVHVGVESVLGDKAEVEGILVRWVRRMLNLVSNHELGLFAITGRTSRFNNHYCNTITHKWDGKLTTQSSVKVIEDETAGHSQRYYTLNLCNLNAASKRTVEFRLFGATLNGYQAIGYIITAMGIAHRAAQVGTAPKFKASYSTADVPDAVRDLQKLLRNYGWPSGAKKAWGREIRQVQREAAERFDRDLVQGVTR
jgi:hypothetical protein